MIEEKERRRREARGGAARVVRRVILLAGRVGRNAFADGVARSALDLPVDARRTLLDVWTGELDDFAREFDLERLEVRVAVDRNSPPPHKRAWEGGEVKPRVHLTIEHDPQDYRGTAGVVRDLTRDCPGDERVLVVTANQLQLEPLHEVVAALARHEEAASIVPQAGGEFAGMFLLRCARLAGVPDIGFVDLKEQAIPASGDAKLFVVRRPAGSALPVRTLAEYILALRAVYVPETDDAFVPEDPYAETWKPAFAIVEPGAHVAPGAVLHDSVVLAGGRVETGAVVARSVVCAHGVVRRGHRVVDSIVTD